ncbi:helix-turn-helix domain-containing protein [Anaerohalosphaeraceae bacterium U12dextr]
MRNIEYNSNIRIADTFLKYPGITDTPESIEAFIDRQISARTSKLKRLMALRKMSSGDIRQEFLMAIVAAMARFDSTQSSWKTYVSGVCNNRYCQFRREYCAETTALGNRLGLDVMKGDESSIIPTYEVDFDAPIDVNTVVDKLPSRLRQVANLLKTHSPAQAASRLGVSRSTVSRAINRIREYFLAAGFQNCMAMQQISHWC